MPGNLRYGVKVKIDGKMVLAGNGKLMDEERISYTECDSIGTVVYVAEDGRFLARSSLQMASRMV